MVAAMVFATVGFLATASRMSWAFAREQGLPGSRILAKVLLKKVFVRVLLTLFVIGRISDCSSTI